MIPRKEFYFVRHGQTDHNLREGLDKWAHGEEVPLNATGKEQARTIEPLIASLPIQTVVTSPMKRAQETKEIIAPRLKALHYDVEHLGECNANIWKGLKELKIDTPFPEEGEVYLFLEKVAKGLNHALSYPGPLLIVAHGGVHWATCFLMQVEEYDWSLHNCGVVHFFVKENGAWGAKRL